MADFVIYEDHTATVLIGIVPTVVSLKGGQVITDSQYPIPLMLAAGFRMVQLNFVEIPAGSVVAFRVFTAVGGPVAYTPFDNTKRMFAVVVGGGGGGGGASFAASNEAYGGGGGGGGYAAKLFTYNPQLAYSYTVGGGGAGGANTGGAGGTGGTSSFASEDESISAAGGAGGTGMVTGATALQAAGGAGGVGSAPDGDIATPGGYGQNGVRISGTFGWSGAGGDAGGGYGIGARGRESGADAGNNYGGGGSGAGAGASATVGGAGAQGVVLVWEYA